jgi:SNF2-related domain
MLQRRRHRLLGTHKCFRTVEEVLAHVKLPFELKPKQLWAVNEIAPLDRGAFFTKVGTGKTVLSTVTALKWNARKIVIAMPPILLDQWEAWLNSIGEMDVSIYRGPKRTSDMLEHRWVLMSHAIFRDSFGVIKEAYDIATDVLIMEEAHAAKNPASLLFKYTNQLTSPKGKLLLLTGTPTSKPGDAYSYVKLKTPHVYRSKGHFENLHVGDRDHFGNVTQWKDLDLLADNLALNSVKLTQEDIFGDTLKPLYDTIIYALDDKHKKLYDKLAEEQLLLLESGGKIDATTAQRLYHALQQIVVNWGHFCGEDKRPKAFDLIDEVIEQTDCMSLGSSKLSIWCNYIRSNAAVVTYLKSRFGDRAIAAAYGEVNSAKGVKSIMDDEHCRILVAHPKSAGVGLNIQFVSNEMLFIEASTSPMDMRQTIGRIARAGQTKTPHIRLATAKGTIQHKLFKDLLSNDDLVTKVERSSTSLRNEILGKT